MGEVTLHVRAGAAVKELGDDVDRQVGERVDASGAIQVSGLGNQVLAFQQDIRVLFMEGIQIKPVAGGRFALEQAGLGEEAAAGASRANGGAFLYMCFEPVDDGAVAGDAFARVAPQAGQVNHGFGAGAGRRQLIDALFGVDINAAGRVDGVERVADAQDIDARLAGVGAMKVVGGLQHLQRQEEAGGE